MLRYAAVLLLLLLGGASPLRAQTQVSQQSTITVPNLLCQVAERATSESFHLGNGAAASSDVATHPQVEITGVGLLTPGATRQELQVDVRNVGTVAARAEGSVTLCVPGREEAIWLQVEPFSVAPGEHRSLRVPLRSDTPRGHYLAVPVLEFRGAYAAAARVGVRIR